MLAGFGVAAAQTGSTQPDNGDSGTTAPPPEEIRPAPERGMRAKGFRHGHKLGHGGIHGEFTTRAPSGDGYQTIATQHGEVTAVSNSSLTVKSEDGFSRTYVIDDNTLVNAGNDGIADVKTGDSVHVMAIVTDGKANAVDVRDGTRIRELRERWRPGPPRDAED